MTPEDAKRLSACLQEAAEILSRNTPDSQQPSFEVIEKTLRTYWLEKIGPQIAFFLSEKLQEQKKVESEL